MGIFKKAKEKPDPLDEVKQQLLDGSYSGNKADLVIIDDVIADDKHDDAVDAVKWDNVWQQMKASQTLKSPLLTSLEKGQRLTQMAQQLAAQSIAAMEAKQHAQMAAQIQQQYANVNRLHAQQSLMGSQQSAANIGVFGGASSIAAASGNVLVDRHQGSWWRDDYANIPDNTVTHLEAKIAEQQQIIDTMRWIIETGHFAYPPEMESTVKGDKP